jgi:peptide deformylase
MLKIETIKNNPVLRQRCQTVKEINKDLLGLIKKMQETLAVCENGIGLAAPQVGYNLRLFVISPDLALDGKVVFINPEITQSSPKKIIEEEGCLSLPGDWQELARCEKVTIKAMDENGLKFKLRAKGLLARLMQHEVDHLNGILFVDHLK